jgi:thiamine biosynthesis lipoprotein
MENHNFEFISMTTPCKVQIYKESRSKALKCFEEIKKNTLYLEKKYNFYDSESFLSKKINNRSKNVIKVDFQTAEVLNQIRVLSKEVNNHFDITVGTLKECYKKDTLLEVTNSLALLNSKIGIDSWDIQNRILTFKYDETKIDLGGVIKEYAVDEAARIIKKYGISSAIINFGGDIYCIGKRDLYSLFSIGIKNPKDKSKNLFSINLENQALTTSANYERSFNVEDKKFSQIISKKNEDGNILSSTVV